jgi:hypothetical protein
MAREQDENGEARPRTHLYGESDVARWSAALPEDFLLCRDLGHTWRPASARWVPEVSAYERTMRCGRCRAEREQTLSAGGLILSGHYRYESGYTTPPGSGMLGSEGRGALRLESIARLIGKDSLNAKGDR